MKNRQTPVFRRPFIIPVIALLLSPLASSQQPQAPALSIVSTGNYSTVVSPDSIAAIFGQDLASMTVPASLNPDGSLPQTLSGISVTVNGRKSGLFFVSPNQVNIHIPETTEVGLADVQVISAAGKILASGQAQVAPAAPALFSSDSTGRGPGAILNGVTYKAGPFDVQTTAAPTADKRTRLAIFATGIRLAPALLSRYEPDGNVAAYVSVSAVSTDGLKWDLPVEYAGPAPVYFGLDQINVVLPAELDGAGQVDLTASIGETRSNPVSIVVRSSQLPQISAVTPTMIAPGGSVHITGTGFAGNGVDLLARSSVIVIPAGVKEYAFQPVQSTDTSLDARIPPFSLPGTVTWYTGPAQLCIEVDSQRSCAGGGINISPPPTSPDPLGTQLVTAVRDAQTASLDVLRLLGSSGLVSAAQTASDVNLRNLQTSIAHAAAGNPDVVIRNVPGGPQKVVLDQAFFSRVDSIMLATKDDTVQALAKLQARTRIFRERLASPGCALTDEQKKIDQKQLYDATLILDDVIQWATITGSAAALGTCLGSSGTLCAAALASLEVGEEIATAGNLSSLINRVVIDIGPNRLDAINIKPVPPISTEIGTDTSLDITGTFKGLAAAQTAANAADAEIIQGIAVEIITDSILRAIPVLSGDLKNLARSFVEEVADAVWGALSSDFMDYVGTSLDVSQYRATTTIPIGSSSLQQAPLSSTIASLSLACGNSTPVSLIHPLQAGSHQIFDLTAKDSLLWTGDYPPEHSLVVRVSATSAALASFQLSSTRFVVGETGYVSITLTHVNSAGAATVSLTCDSTASSIPCSISVPAGQTSVQVPFTVLKPSNSPSGTQITAAYGGVQLNTSFFVAAAPDTLLSVDLDPASLTAGAFSTGTVRLSQPAPATGVDVHLASSSDAVQVPTTVRIPAGFDNATFQVKSISTASSAAVTISGVLGNITRSVRLTISASVRGMDVVSVTTSKTSYRPGESVVVTYVVRNNTSKDSGPFRNGISGWYLPSRTGFITFSGMASIPPGGQASDSTTLQLSTNDPAGTYTVRVTADYYDAVADEGGNPSSIAQASFTVGP